MSIDLAQIPDESVRHEWAHFRGFGWDDERIATRLGYSEDTPKQWALRAPKVTRGTRQHREARRGEIRRLTSEGWTAAEIASALGCSIDTVHKDRRRMGLLLIGDQSAECPVCLQKVQSTAVYAHHRDVTGHDCPMSGQALEQVAS
ncbi:hypothetical protein EF294_03195 [Gordonia oryzae]|uniref:Uncharacterized protein n=1 Tax=Gordonia oryzae TaxID=2487349 RepID=A0A3N4GWE8_9ACTN|nr:helix-turn-helix domain-containing protein [Gordonia oryzae]RPA65757.1 hypothetical protein EF294_03195 [Gordonia oryzae]